LRLGFLLGLSYFGVHLATPLSTNPATTLLQFATAVALCAGFGWSVSLARLRWGFNPLLTALFWVAFELLLIRAGFAHGLLAELDVGTGLMYRVGILFGFLAISFVVVLVNAILVLAIETTIEKARARGTVYPESKRIWDPFLAPGLADFWLYLASSERAPPLSAC